MINFNKLFLASSSKVNSLVPFNSVLILFKSSNSKLECILFVPSYFECIPSTVLILIIVGLLLFLAFSIALDISLTDSPFLTSRVFQFILLNLSRTFSSNVLSVLPSAVISLESYNTIKLSKDSVPASEAAS